MINFQTNNFRFLKSKYALIISIFLMLVYSHFFGVIYLSDVDVIFKKLELSVIDNWHLLGGYLVALVSYSLSPENPKVGLLIAHYFSFMLLSILFFKYAGNNINALMIFILGPEILFSNIIYKDFFCYPVFYLILTRYWSIGPAILSLFKFEWVILYYLFLPLRNILNPNTKLENEKKFKKNIYFSIVILLLTIGINTASQNAKSHIELNLLQTYHYGLKVLRGDVNEDARVRWLECREFEQENIQYTKHDLATALKNLAQDVIAEPTLFVIVVLQKSQCAYINIHRFGLTPSATYGFNGEMIDYLNAGLTQLSPFMKPLFSLIIIICFARKISFSYGIFIFISLSFILPMLRINQEFRYSIPIILIAQFLVCNWISNKFKKIQLIKN